MKDETTIEQHILNALVRIGSILDERLPKPDDTESRHEREDAVAESCDSCDEADLYFERMEKAEAERDDWKADAEARKRVVDNRGEQIASLTERNVDLTAERDGWKARYKALRADVEEFQYRHRGYSGAWELMDILDRDTERGE